MRTALAITLMLLVLTCSAMAQTWTPVPGETGTITINSPYSADGANASLWGFYSISNGWKSQTFGAGVFINGIATVDYTIPSDFQGNFYWNAIANYSPTRGERSQYTDDTGGWGQFFTSNPNGISVAAVVFGFDQKSVTTRTASFRASTGAGTAFPPADRTLSWVSVRTPWTGTLHAFAYEPGGYYDNSKTSLLPSRLPAGYSVEVLEGDPEAVQQFQKIRLHNEDNSYSVELFGFKNTSSEAPGYLWWVTLVDVQSADCVYDSVSKMFSGEFEQALETGTMYFVVPELVVYDTTDSTTSWWVQQGSGTDLLLSGASFTANQLSLNTNDAGLYVRPGETVVFDLDVSNLTTAVNACQAMMGYSSDFFDDPTNGCIALGGGSVWDELLWDSWKNDRNEPGEPEAIDTAIGVKAQALLGTVDDGTVCKINLKVADDAADGTTQLFFRADGEVDTKVTMLSPVDLSGPIWPAKLDSQSIVIDGTAPVMESITPAANSCLSGTETFVFDFSDTYLKDLELDIFGPGHETQETKVQVTLAARDLTPDEEAYAANIGAAVDYDEVNQKWTVTIDTTCGFWTDGDWRWYVEVEDMAGNKWGNMMSPPAYSRFDWSIDNTAPVITVTPDDGAVFTAATQVVLATATDAVAGIQTFTYSLNGADAVSLAAGENAITLALVPGTNTVVFTATDNVNHQTVRTVTYTYNQPVPLITMRMSQAPNGYGSPSYPQWDLNAIAAIQDDLPGPVGSGYATFDDIDLPADYAKTIVTNFDTWNGLLVPDNEGGSRIHAIYKFDSGVRTNPGAAKLDLTKLWVKGTDHYTGTDNGQAYSYVHSDYQIASLPGRNQFGTNTRLRGYNWNGVEWAEVTSGTFADLIIYDNGEGLEPPKPYEPNQATLNALYKNMSGAVAWPEGTEPDALILQGIRARYSSLEFEVRYEDGTVLPSASQTATATLDTDDATAPVISITSLTDGQETNDATQTIAGTVADLENLASGVREVQVFLNGTQVGSTYNTSDPVNFSEDVTLVEGNNVIEVTAVDFGGNSATKTISVLLDTTDPTIAITGWPDADPVTQGSYQIVVTASDASSGLAGAPVVEVKSGTNVIAVGTAVKTGDVYSYALRIDASTANGEYTVTATVADEAGNSASAEPKAFTVNKNQITGSVESEGFVGDARAVTFVATNAAGAVLKTWADVGLTFTGAVAPFALTDVPDGTVGLSAKTNWTLRSKVACVDTGNGQLTANFTGGDKLLGGDLNNTNSVNVLDYSIMKVNWMDNGVPTKADVNGDGSAETLDYILMKGNWFKTGDAL